MSNKAIICRYATERRNDMINIGICDDNIQMLNTLYTLIYNEFKKFTDDFEITKLTNGIVTLNENKLAPFDVLFLDIDMPRMSDRKSVV